eukprot:366319-Chlamydomonas_euryale.AAC.7
MQQLRACMQHLHVCKTLMPPYCHSTSPALLACLNARILPIRGAGAHAGAVHTCGGTLKLSASSGALSASRKLRSSADANDGASDRRPCRVMMHATANPPPWYG